MTKLNQLVYVESNSNVSLESLVTRYSRAVLATEEFNSKNIISALTQAFGYVKASFSQLSQSLTGFSVENPKVIEIKNWTEVDQKRFAKNVMSLNYFSFNTMQYGYTPEGMYKTYLEYYEVLRPLCEHISVTQTTITKQYVDFLANILSELNSAIKFSKNNTSFYDDLNTNRQNMKNKLLSCYKPNSEREIRSVGEVIKRNADWARVFTLMDECNKLVDGVDVVKIQENVKMACTYIDSILNKLNNGDTSRLEKSNKELLAELSMGAYAMSNEVELVPIIIFKSKVMSSAVLRTAQTIDTALLNGKAYV
jgi:hypothetical protein